MNRKKVVIVQTRVSWSSKKQRRGQKTTYPIQMFHTRDGADTPACIMTNLDLPGLLSSLVGLHGSSSGMLLGRSGSFLLNWDVNAMVSGSVELFDDLNAWACDFTVVVTLRMRGRRMAIEAAMIPVPGSAVAHIVAFMVIARIMINWCDVFWSGGDIRDNPV
jgi:hypothetical protein